jgi:hypothetical protein
MKHDEKNDEKNDDKMTVTEIAVTLVGLSDILFDKFIDHSKEDRPPEQKLYLSPDNLVVLPGENIHSFIFNKKKGGCITAFEGKGAKDYTMREGFVNILETYIPFIVENGETVKFDGFKHPLYIHESSPVTGSGNNIIKQPAQKRPVLAIPWQLSFTISVVENDKINVQKLYNWFSKGGLMVALASYRPRFGRFVISKWELSEKVLG